MVYTQRSLGTLKAFSKKGQSHLSAEAGPVPTFFSNHDGTRCRNIILILWDLRKMLQL